MLLFAKKLYISDLNGGPDLVLIVLSDFFLPALDLADLSSYCWDCSSFMMRLVSQVLQTLITT